MRSAPTLKIWMTPFASVAILEKLALLKMGLWRAPVLSRASWRRTSVRRSTEPASVSRTAGSRHGVGTVPSFPGERCSSAASRRQGAYAYPRGGAPRARRAVLIDPLVQEGTAGSASTTGECREHPRHSPALSSSGCAPGFPCVQLQPLRLTTSVKVTAAFPMARPTKRPRVSVTPAPDRMFPLRSESVSVAAASDHQVTLHATAPPPRTTEKFVPVKAPVCAPSVTLNVQLAVAGPLSVNTPVFASALTQ